MNYKDRLEKLIAAERQRIREFKKSETEFWDRQPERFGLLRGMLEGLYQTIDQKLIEAEFEDEYALITVGTPSDEFDGTLPEEFPKDTNLLASYKWRIEPDYDFEENRDIFERRRFVLPGFRVDEKNYQGSDFEKTIRFLSEKVRARNGLTDLLR